MPTILIIVILLFITLTVYMFVKHENTINRSTIEIIDTSYNTIVLDSIKYNIIVKDSVITHIRHKYEDSIIKVVHFDDSSSVELFKRLVSE